MSVTRIIPETDGRWWIGTYRDEPDVCRKCGRDFRPPVARFDGDTWVMAWECVSCEVELERVSPDRIRVYGPWRLEDPWETEEQVVAM